MANASNLIERLGKEFKGNMKLSEDEQAIYVPKETIVEFLKVLKGKFGFNMLIDITSAEYDDSMEVVYHLMALENAEVIKIKVSLSKDNLTVPSAIPVWKAANVMEREVYDLMGVNFEGHDNLKRILCPPDFEGHPLRKEFKLKVVDKFN